jgi:hypothetical protein
MTQRQLSRFVLLTAFIGSAVFAAATTAFRAPQITPDYRLPRSIIPASVAGK